MRLHRHDETVDVPMTASQKSGQTINPYRTAARSARELGLGDLVPMDHTIPELAEA